MACGCPGIYFLNTAKRAMDFLNIGLSGLALKSNVQGVDELLMDEVIGKELLMKSVKAAVQEYDTELTLDIAVLKRHLGYNVDVDTSTSTDDPVVITEDEYEEEAIQEARNSVEIKEFVKVGQQTDSSGSTSPTISDHVCKLFPGMGWFAGNIDGTRLEDNENIYEILFEDGDTEEWRKYEYANNSANACIPIGNT